MSPGMMGMMTPSTPRKMISPGIQTLACATSCVAVIIQAPGGSVVVAGEGRGLDQALRLVVDLRQITQSRQVLA